ncbi:MAG: PIN domain-containing protein [Bryobacteraceae bacterium]|jgi:PIN domain nuclease of toxin-antitoxin system
MLNLDTHILIHALGGRLTPRERQLLSGNLWSISAIVLWELSKLFELGRTGLDIASPEFALALAQIRVWPLDLAVCRAIRALDFRGDPADEIIAATSLVHNVPLITRDRRMRKSKRVPLA